MKQHDKNNQEDDSIKSWLYVCNTDMHLRYVLGELGKKPLICIGLNPSTAIPDYLDSTLERVRAIAKNHKCDSWIMLNIYPYRGSDPKMLPDNSIDDRYINQNINEIEKILEKYPKSQVLCAWGDNITQKRYIAEVFRDKLLKVLIKYENRLKCLKLTKKDHPCHPSRFSTSSEFIKFKISEYTKLKIFQK